MPKLFNRGQRTFNPNTPYVIKPNAWSPELTEEQAAKLLKMFPRELTSDEGVAQKHNLRVAELEQELANEKAANKQLRDQVAGLQKLLDNDPLTSNINPSSVPTPLTSAQPGGAKAEDLGAQQPTSTTTAPKGGKTTQKHGR